VIRLESLKRTDRAKEEQLQREPLSWTDAVKSHICRDFKKHDPERQHLLPNIELVLCDADVLEEFIGERVGDIAAV
jgi:hypothetical protein